MQQLKEGLDIVSDHERMKLDELKEMREPLPEPWEELSPSAGRASRAAATLKSGTLPLPPPA